MAQIVLAGRVSHTNQGILRYRFTSGTFCIFSSTSAVDDDHVKLRSQVIRLLRDLLNREHADQASEKTFTTHLISSAVDLHAKELFPDIQRAFTIVLLLSSPSLKAMPASMIRHDEEKGLDWTTMGLYAEEIERAEPHDTQDDFICIIG